MKTAIDWHLAEIERLRGIKIKSRQIRRRILFHEISAKELEALNTRTVRTVEELAAYLCDEFDYDLNPVHGASWPEHENDEGKREGGYIRLQPSDVQAYARENAKRILTFLGLPTSPGASNQSDAEAIAENYLQEIQDGAWGDNGRTRGLARDRLKATRPTGGSDADA